jgi:hypothetical protein
VVNDSVVCAELDGEAVLLDVDSGTYFGLDCVGMDIWKIVERGATEAEIVAGMLEQYEVAATQLQADVAMFLDALRGNGLIRELDL